MTAVTDELMGVTTPAADELARVFGLVGISGESLTPWASVHLAKTPCGESVVVKRTATTKDRATAISDWTHALQAAGVSVVAPVQLEHQNPQPVGEDWWVVYPFIEGRPYQVDNWHDIAAAGALLGQIHSAPIAHSVLDSLRRYEWPETDRRDIDNDLAALAEVFGSHLDRDASRADAATINLANRWWDSSLPLLRAADDELPLPRTGVSSDFKANNLVYTGGAPTLVDPDNGGLEPRLFDLAMALVLFHNECPAAPGRLFTPDEWRTFATAYLEKVTLTDRERALWPAALDHMLWEEGTWILEDNDSVAWADDRQGAYLADLATTDPHHYPLPV